jgi:hypothetical protein
MVSFGRKGLMKSVISIIENGSIKTDLFLLNGFEVI